MRMNSPTGKKILALVRQGDYAHPGEEAVIDLALRDFAPDRERLILDVGCGWGGTAHYLQDRGWGQVVGFDIDEASIAYAQAAYPEVMIDISPKFGEWYTDLVSRIEAREKQIMDLEGPAWYRFVHDFYEGMLAAIQRGSLGGVLVYARAG